MSIMDELKKLTRPYDDDTLMDDDGLDLDLDEPAYSQPAQTAPVQPQPAVTTQSAPAVSSTNPMSSFSVNDIPRTTASPISMGGVPDASKYRVVLVKPEDFDAATSIAKHICQGDTVILNCEDTNETVARRVIDFLSGCAFALDGSLKKASTNVIIIAPKDVGVDDVKDEENA